MSPAHIPWVSADEVFARVSFGDAIRAIRRDIRAGLDPSTDFDRGIIELSQGQLLLMPTESSQFVGVKVTSVAPNNPSRGQERIQGVYVLMDSASLTPVALLDGRALTTLRTPAVSAAVADILAPETVDHVVVFGSGPQSSGHIEALRAIRTINRVTVVARDRGQAQAFADQVTASGIPTTVGSAADIADAQIVVCATTAREPIFDGRLVPDDCCVIAVGSHEPDARELDSDIISRAQVVVEGTAVALRECGDVIIPVDEGRIAAADLVPMRDILIGSTPVDFTRPRVFKSSGMSWEDLVVAAEVYRRGVNIQATNLQAASRQAIARH